jgi:hypothetical protein
LKIASFWRGALAETRWAHFNYRDKNAPRSNPIRSSHDKGRMKLAEKTDNLQISLSPRWGASGASATVATSRSLSRSPVPCGAEPRVATKLWRGHRPDPRGLVGSHVAEPERHDSSGVVLLDHLCQGDSGIQKMPEHGPVRLEHILLLFLGRAIGLVPLRLRD